MPDSRLNEIAREFVVATGAAPAAAVAVAWRGGAGFRTASGAAFAPGKPEVGPSAYFDLASVTKPFLAITVARLVRRGRLSLATPLGELLPAARGTPTGAEPVELLLAHRAGLEAHRTLFAPLLAEALFDPRVAMLEAVHARRPECRGSAPDGYPPVYSDLGYALVGLALEHLERLPLDQIVDREICAPLDLDIGSARVLRARHSDFAARCVPTETVPFRGGVVHGIVHDENAWALSGHALSGHAGLFGTAESVARFGAALLDALHARADTWLDEACLRPLLRERPGGTLRAGFDGKSAEGSSAGARVGAQSFGHLGFTGTSLWCDPDADRALVLLSNRVCPTRGNTRIRAARPAVHDALFDSVFPG